MTIKRSSLLNRRPMIRQKNLRAYLSLDVIGHQHRLTYLIGSIVITEMLRKISLTWLEPTATIEIVGD